MLSLRSDVQPLKISDPVVVPEARAFINHLRFVAMACRVKPRAELFKACVLLKAEPVASLEAYSDALVRCLGQALGATPRFLAPGVKELTFDEKWLMQLGMACVQEDIGSQKFLLASRVSFENRRLVRFLTHRIADGFV